jgi:hypothetical protein
MDLANVMHNPSKGIIFLGGKGDHPMPDEFIPREGADDDHIPEREKLPPAEANAMREMEALTKDADVLAEGAKALIRIADGIDTLIAFLENAFEKFDIPLPPEDGDDGED